MTAEYYLRPGTFEEKFIRSSGPGGQNVNKVATSVVLRYYPEISGLPDYAKEKIKKLAGGKYSSDGVITIVSEESRSQAANRQNARVKILELIEKALKPAKKRRATKPTYSSKIKRLDRKKHDSQKKRLRKKDFE